MGVSEFFDAGANLNDSMYQGIYNDKKIHEEDLKEVIERAHRMNVTKMLVLCGSIDEYNTISNKLKDESSIYYTVGIHPTNTNKYNEDELNGFFDSVENLYKKFPSKLIAYGELGLDYDRLNFSPKEKQLEYFEKQLYFVAKKLNQIPLYFHMRAATDDFLAIYDKFSQTIQPSIVHCFTGSLVDLKKILLRENLFIGVTGCSMKTEENLQMIENIPIDRLILETDCPWCSIGKSSKAYPLIGTHFPALRKDKWLVGNFVQGRQEPSHLIQLAEIVSAIKKISVNEVANKTFVNTSRLFRLL